MARGFKTGGRDFKKGVSGNPKGGPGAPQELKDLRKYSVNEIRGMVSVLLRATRPEVLRLIDDDSTPILENIMAQVLIKTYESGNFMMLDAVLNRVIGKVKERFEIDDEREAKKSLSLDELKALSLAIRNRAK